MHKIGRRKSSIANVQAVLGTGKILINKKSDAIYFQKQSLLLSIIHSPLKKIQAENKYDFYVTVTGGGNFSQAYAIRLGIARVLTHLSNLDSDKTESPNDTQISWTDSQEHTLGPPISDRGTKENNENTNTFLNVENAKEHRIIFKQEHYLTRDPRVKERRKYGLKKARRASQFSKR